MRVLITGSTGFLGAHATAAVRAAGHDVRVLVRDREKAARVLGTVGAGDVELASGDVTDDAAVKEAVEGCDAVIHAAALLTFDKRRQDEMLHTNTVGTRLVLGAAQARQLDPIVQVSSVSALFPPEGERLTTETEVKEPRDPYARSKARSERLARAMQAQGAPVVCVYPGFVWGPDDPTLGNQITTIYTMVKLGYYLTPPASVTVIDVRDVALALAHMLEPGRGPRRYMLAGRRISHEGLRQLFARLTGRRFLRVPVPGWTLTAAGRFGDWLRAWTPLDPGAITYEAMQIATSTYECDDEPTLRDLGLELRPTEETIADQMRWMGRIGYLRRRQLGDLAD